MKTEALFSNIYPEISPSLGVPHPVSGLTYKLLSDTQLIQLAHRTVDVLLGMNIEQILVSESGAVPFARVCAYIAQKRQPKLHWYSIKIPRNIQQTFLPTFQAYLSLPIEALRLSHQSEHKISGFSFQKNSEHALLPESYFDSQGLSLKDILESLQNEVIFFERDYFLKRTRSTALAQILENKFIFFDEYIDSGKTLFQAFRFFHLFSNALQFKVLSYLVKLPKADLNQDICESLYTNDDAFEAYEWGVYPFENRIDWLGYYYVSNSETFQKVAMSNLDQSNHFSPLLYESPHSKELSAFIKQLSQDTILSEVRYQCTRPEISQWLTHKQLIQYCLFILEEMHFGQNTFSELLYQLFDLYGPMWTPLPANYHLDYIDAFEKTNSKIIQVLSTASIGPRYQRLRQLIMQNVICLHEKRRLHQQQNLSIALEKIYAA